MTYFEASITDLMTRFVNPCFHTITSSQNMGAIARELISLGIHSPSRLIYVNVEELETHLKSVIDPLYIKLIVRCICEYDSYYKTIQRQIIRATESEASINRMGSLGLDLRNMEDLDAYIRETGLIYPSLAVRRIQSIQSGRSDQPFLHGFDRNKQTYGSVCSSQWSSAPKGGLQKVKEKVHDRYHSDEL